MSPRPALPRRAGAVARTLARALAVRALAVRALAAVALTAAAGCSAVGDAIAPGRPGSATAARLALDARVAQTDGAVALRVRAEYLRTDGSAVPLGAEQSIALTSERTQAVPIELDLAPCLGDPARRPAGTGCAVRLVLDLVRGNPAELLDRQVVGPIDLTPGAVQSAPAPVALFPVATVRVAPLPPAVAPPTGTPLRLELGTRVTLAAQLADPAGQALAGRPVTWASSAPAVATVDRTTGEVTPVAPGTATITASTGAKDGALAVTVVPAPVALVVGANGGTGGGTVTSAPAGVACTFATGAPTGTGACSAPLAADVPVVVTATPDSASDFASWGGACASTSGPVCTLAPNQSRAITATFTRRRVTLTLAFAGAGGGTLQLNGTTVCTLRFGDGSVPCPPQAVDAWAPVTLTVVPDGASVFLSWSGACAAAQGASCTLTLGQAASTGAVVLPRPVALTVAQAAGTTGTGRVATADGASCAITPTGATGTCSRTLGVGTTVVLIATPDAGSVFGGWTGACAESDGPICSLVIPNGTPPVVGARFLAQRTVEVAPSNTVGGARVVSTPAGIDCTVQGSARTGTCAAPFLVGAVVTLAVTPDSATAVDGWTGACTASGPSPCVVTVAAGAGNQVATLVLARRQVALTLTFAGTGGGALAVNGVTLCTLTRGAGSVSCPAQLVAATEPVTITVTPDAFSFVAAWSGACATAQGPSCTLRPGSPVTVGVTTTARNPVAVTPTGTGGRVTSTPAAIDCVRNDGVVTGTCFALFGDGASVTLTAAPEAGSRIAGWTGACANASGTTCTVTAPRGAGPAVTAGVEFEPATATLTLASSGTGSGTFALANADGGPPLPCAYASPSGSCSFTLSIGSRWIVNAGPDEATTFVRWTTGPCTGSTNPSCAFTLAGPTTLTALVELSVPSNFPLSATQVSAGDRHACAVDQNGGVWCWGANESGQIGDGSQVTRQQPSQVRRGDNSLLVAQEVHAAVDHSCAVTVDGEVWCWGSNANGKLGQPTGTVFTRAVRVTGGSFSRAAVLAVGDDYTCAVPPTGSRQRVCWGLTPPGVGSTTPSEYFSAPGAIATLSLARNHGCTIAAESGSLNEVWCWGSANTGQLGLNNDVVSDIQMGSAGITAVGPGNPIRQTLAVGSGPDANGRDGHGCAIAAGGVLKCWGLGRYGATGLATSDTVYAPTSVVDIGSGVQAVAAGRSGTCALDAANRIQCWGTDGGLLGGAGAPSGGALFRPQVVGGLPSMTSVTVGRSFACGIATSGRAVWCWGANTLGQLGRGTIAPGGTAAVVTIPTS